MSNITKKMIIDLITQTNSKDNFVSNFTSLYNAANYPFGNEFTGVMVKALCLSCEPFRIMWATNTWKFTNNTANAVAAHYIP